MKLKILLTGGGGFFGKNFIEKRKDIYKILSPTHSQLDLVNTKAVDSYFRKKGPFDVVLHAATLGGKRYEKGMRDVTEINLRIFFNIVRNKHLYRKMINFGTGAEYDKSGNIRSVKEIDFSKRIPADSFGFYKYICSTYIEESERMYDLRIFSLFGKYEDYKVRFISNLICKYILKLPLSMIQDTFYDFLDVADLIKILDYFIVKTPKYKSYNAGSGKRISLLSVAKQINKLGIYSLPIKIRKSGLNKEYTCNNSRLVKELKNFSFTPLDVSIRNLYEWYKDNIHTLDTKAIIKDSYN